MKTAKGKHLLRSIRKGGVSYLAVAIIAGVSISIFHGFQSSGNAILQRADRYFKENNLETLEIACANGITQDDLNAIAGWEGVTAAEGGYTDSVLLNTGEERIVVQARSLLDTINQPVVVEGTLPAAADEVAIEENMAVKEGIGVGDTITLEQDGCLTGDTFRVAAVINLPVFNSVSLLDTRGTADQGLGANEYYVCLTEDAFDPDYYSDCYTAAYIDSDVLDGLYYFSDAYAQKEADYLERLEPLAQERAQLRYDQLNADVQGELDDAQAELDDAKEELAQGEAEYADGQSAYDEQADTLAAARSQLDAQLAALGLPADLDQALTAAQAMGGAGAPLSAVIRQYQDGAQALEEAAESLEEAAQTLEDARQEIADGEAELADARAEAEDLQTEPWVLSGRENVGDVRSLAVIVDTIYGLSYVMSLLFLLVAVVVCFAAITRVIREQRVLIGAQKALGFTPGEIFKHYLLYNLSCAVVGTLVGWFLAISTVETMSLNIFVPKLCIGAVPLNFTWSTALLSGGICLVVFFLATIITCSKLVKEPAVDLLRGDAPTRGKQLFFERWGFYRRLSLYARTMVKNVLNDKGRMATTIVGVMGCTALLVACFSMKLGIQNAAPTQFDQYASYDYRLVVDSQTGSVDDFAALLDQEGISYTQVQEKLKNFRAQGGRWETAHVMTVSEGDALDGFLKLWELETGESRMVPQGGVLLSRRAAEELDLAVGDTLELMDGSGQGRRAVVSGIIEHYLAYHLIVTSDSYYEEILDEEADPCVFLIKGDVTGLADQVRDMDGFLSLRDNSEYQRNGGELDMVIAICTILSAVMSVLVMLNQITMYISRKARELAVMRVNGYTMGQTKAYVYKDNILLMILGLVAGCLFGILMAYVSVRTIEAGAEHYVRSPNLLACLLACAIMAVFAVIVNLIALRKINHLSLTNVSSN